ncbi:MAG: hypothetical protein D6692_04530 [Planctomycetota bacterium]|nr:MAG: hypothetical protein D6692_04530 [Planctomycetota bacterium]
MPPAADHAEPRPLAYMPGERFWWVAQDGTLMVRSRSAAPAIVAMASGRVSAEAALGVIERWAGRDATLGLISIELIELLARRFPGVRWAVPDVPLRVPSGRAITEHATA